MVDTRQFANEGNKNLLGVEGALQVNAILQNRYRIEGVLGVGGMGSVYQARDLQFPEAKRYVAVKEMLHHTSDPQLREIALRNFQREANILASLNHPAIPTIHDYFSTKERAYVVMEFINGSDMDTILTRHEDFLPVHQVIEWSITLCDVLAYLHTSEPPIIFRDVKPSNIMVDVRGHVRLIDFGIAKHFEPNTKGTMIGTEGYAAPESYRGQASPSSDVFGVGATLHHVLTRRDPRLEAPFTFAERPIRSINPAVPPDVEVIVMKALAFNSDERFGSALEMKQALQNALMGGRVPSISTSGGSMPSATEALSDDAWGDKAQAFEPLWKFKVEEEIRSTPVAHGGMVYVTAYDNNLYAIGADDGQIKWKFATDDVIGSSPAVAAAEGLVIFGSKDHSLYAVDMRTGRVRWTYQSTGPIYSSPTVEHGHVFFGSDDGFLYALRVATGRAAWKQPANAPVRCKPAVTEDRIVYGSKEGELFCVDLGGQQKWRFKARREIISSPVVLNNVAYFGSMDGHIYAVSMENGWAGWKLQTNKPVISSPALGDGRLYIGSANGIMYAIDPSNGRELWKFETGHQITSSPAFYNGAIYFGANNNKIYCLDAKNSKERWSYTTGGVVPGSPHIHDGHVYIGSTDHHLYAFKA